MKLLFALPAVCVALLAQQPPAPPPAEQAELQHALAEAGNSQIEVLRVIEKHLAKYPATVFRPDLEHRAVEAAIAIHDDRLVVRYGEVSLARMPDDIKILPEVTRSLLALNTKDAWDRSLKYARRTEDLARQYLKGDNPSNMNPHEWRNRLDRILARALADDSHATLNLGRADEALTIAQRGYETLPTADGARQLALCYERLSKPMEAVRALADAFAIPDPQATEAERSKDRAQMGALYRKDKGNETGLGAIALEAYDRTAAALQARDKKLWGNEPNYGVANPMDFTLTSVDGQKLAMSNLKGKVVVMDMWATWCQPCREQHPLYEQVKERFRTNPSVVFLSINADAERQPVKSFLSALKWPGPVYYEDGLASAYSVASLPVTIILDRRGQLFTRKDGYVKETFVEVLTDRIREALAVAAN